MLVLTCHPRGGDRPGSPWLEWQDHFSHMGESSSSSWFSHRGQPCALQNTGQNVARYLFASSHNAAIGAPQTRACGWGLPPQKWSFSDDCGPRRHAVLCSRGGTNKSPHTWRLKTITFIPSQFWSPEVQNPRHWPRIEVSAGSASQWRLEGRVPSWPLPASGGCPRSSLCSLPPFPHCLLICVCVCVNPLLHCFCRNTCDGIQGPPR